MISVVAIHWLSAIVTVVGVALIVAAAIAASRSRRTSRQTTPTVGQSSALFLGIGIALLVTALACLALAAMCTMLPDPSMHGVVASMAMFAVFAIASGVVIVKRPRR